MNLLKKLSSLFTDSPSGSRSLYSLSLRCNRCGEIIQAQVNLNSELSAEYGPNGDIASYQCRKVLVGTQRCFQQIELALTFDANRKLTDRQVTGGKIEEGQ